MIPRVVIGGLAVPVDIVRAMLSGRWVLPSAGVSVNIGNGSGSVRVKALYSLDSMLIENAPWWGSGNEERSLYGAHGPDAAGGIRIRPELSLLIGDAGYDEPLALDYSGDSEDPRVLYLPPGLDEWVCVAPGVPDLLRMLGVR